MSRGFGFDLICRGLGNFSMNTVFSHGNQLYVLIASIARHLLEIGDMAGGPEAEEFEGRHAPEISVPLLLMEYHHADQPTRDVYDDLKSVLRLPFVIPTTVPLRAGRVISLSPGKTFGTKSGRRRTRQSPKPAMTARRNLPPKGWPNPGGLSSISLCRAAKADAGLNEIIQVCRLFQWLIPGLIVNVAYSYFRHQLEAV